MKINRQLLSTAIAITCLNSFAPPSEASSKETWQFKSENFNLPSIHVAKLKGKEMLIPIEPQHGIISFNQIYFDYDQNAVRGSDWGAIKVNRKELARKFGRGALYMNVFYPGGKDGTLWLVDNLYIPPASPNEPHQTLHVTKHLDLRPNAKGHQAIVSDIGAIVVVSKSALPINEEMLKYTQASFSENVFEVTQTLENAQGEHGNKQTNQGSIDILSISEPPPPVYVPTQSNPEFAAPIAVYQDAYPNIQSAKNQCVPMAHANTLQYLENQFNTLPMYWDLPEAPVPGIGRVTSYDDVLFWQAIPENSVVAQIDTKTMRNGVLDVDSGSGSGTCQNFRGVMAYLNQRGLNAEFSHQGRGLSYGYLQESCDSVAGANIGEFSSLQEGEEPTWEWMFEKLSKGNGVSIAYGRYDNSGNRTGGHMLRVWGASQINNTRYLHLLDDGQQGSNQTGLQLQQFKVEDTGTPGEPGTPDGRLNIDNTNWEIELAVAIKARPTLLIN